MIAVLLFTLFAAGLVLAVGVIATTVRTYAGAARQVAGQLREAEAMRNFRYSVIPVPQRPAATVYRLRFKPKDWGLPFQPGQRAAA